VNSRAFRRVGKPLLWAGSRERKRRIDFPKAVQSDILSMPIKPTDENKKTSKMKDDPDKLMKTNGQISDKMTEANKCMKNNQL
jgi:hypothetical protein